MTAHFAVPPARLPGRPHRRTLPGLALPGLALLGLPLLGLPLPGLQLGAAAAETLHVGPGQQFERPSQAAAVAREGDTVLIAPGRYADCAVWRVPGVTIAAETPIAGTPATAAPPARRREKAPPPAAPAAAAANSSGVEILGPACGGKGLFVTTAPRITIIGLTFRGASVPDGNGAGIRAEGGDLTIRRSRFETNENGILAGSAPAATLLIEDSVFIGNGALRPGKACAHGLYAGQLGQVVIRRTRFEASQVCHHVKSRALRTEITDSTIIDTPAGTSSYLVDIPNGGDLLLRGNRLSKGPRSGNPATAIAIGFEGVSQPTASLSITGNRFENLQPGSTTFVGNRSGTPARLSGNRLTGAVVPLAGPGEVR